MIWECVVNPSATEEFCSFIIERAQENLDWILKPNLVEILHKVDEKMAKNSIVIFSGYAQYFNTEEEACGNNEDWTIAAQLTENHPNGLDLTLERRKKFKNLVEQINGVIQDSIDEARKTAQNYYIGFSHWDRYPREGVRGQYCDPDGTGEYPDPKQPNLQFFKLNTVRKNQHNTMRVTSSRLNSSTEALTKREEDSWYNTVLYKSPDPKAVALHRLDPLAPWAPHCPGDDETSILPSPGAPDHVGKIFHPNEAGHATMASFALAEIVDLRAIVLGLTPDTFKKTDEWACWSDEG